MAAGCPMQRCPGVSLIRSGRVFAKSVNVIWPGCLERSELPFGPQPIVFRDTREVAGPLCRPTARCGLESCPTAPL
jgi:hypothetical protein